MKFLISFIVLFALVILEANALETADTDEESALMASDTHLEMAEGEMGSEMENPEMGATAEGVDQEQQPKKKKHKCRKHGKGRKHLHGLLP